MRAPLIVLAVGVVLASFGASDANALTIVLEAVGPAHHRLSEEEPGLVSTCHGNGTASLTYSFVGARTFLAVHDDDCVPTWSLLTGCQGVLADGWFHCHRTDMPGRIDATLSPEGVFSFAWDAPTFTERVWANMTRVEGGT